MIVVPVNPIGQRKRQDDVLSFQKITGSYYHFIAYLSLLNDRPNSFYHLNFNFFEFQQHRGEHLSSISNSVFSKARHCLEWFAIHLTYLLRKYLQTYAAQTKFKSSQVFASILIRFCAKWLNKSITNKDCVCEYIKVNLINGIGLSKKQNAILYK